MFSFHKPKVYRSSTGCCICRAKSSSSRFTDSKKYEDDFMDCFQLHERRSGEICNACVLLVKRWKKLPPGSERNWHHVVDARAGPGTKSLTKFKSKNKKKLKLKPTDPIQKVEKLIKKKHIYLKNDRNGREQSPGENSDDMAGDDFMSDMGGHSIPSSPNPSEYIAPRTAAVKQRVKARSPHRHEKGTKRRMSLSPAVSSFLDMSYWKREKVCCGTIFKGPYGVVIVDPRFLKPCQGCRSPHVQQCNAPAAPRTPTTGANAGMHHPASGPEAGAAASASNGGNKGSGSGNSSGNNSSSTSINSNSSNNSSSSNGGSSSSSNGNSTSTSNGSNKLAKTFSDSSSDSGYDESSNQGLGEGGHNVRRSGGAVGLTAHSREDAATANSLAEFAMHAAKRCPQEVNTQAN
ncbi:hypothetical protein R5R35_014128 [Gryllus longicercus]|uniref:Protein FAM60A n=1 Tax=Gryllus longicercus TaxID=2509291 RepID=A0AAN9V912_9ORTH